MVLCSIGVGLLVGAAVWKVAMAGAVAGALAAFGAFTISLSVFRAAALARARRRATTKIDAIGAWNLLDAKPDAWPLLSAAALGPVSEPGVTQASFDDDPPPAEHDSSPTGGPQH